MEDANTGCRVWTIPTVEEGLWERTGSCLLKPCQSSLLEARLTLHKWTLVAHGTGGANSLSPRGTEYRGCSGEPNVRDLAEDHPPSVSSSLP